MPAVEDDVLAVIVDAALLAARAEGLTVPAAQRLAAKICEKLRRELGTLRVYVPAPGRAARDRAILAGRLAGDSRATIAARVGVSLDTVDRVVRRQTQKRRPPGNGLAPEGWGL